MFMKCYVDEPNRWQTIEEAQVRQELACVSPNVDEVLDCMRRGGKARTPWAFYRWTLTVASAAEPAVLCIGEADRPLRSYAEYFRRGLISGSEWRRLEIENLSK